MAQYVFRSLRVDPDAFRAVEALAAAETISVNGLVNALLEYALEDLKTEEGRAKVHEACQRWRVRWEYKHSARRRQAS